MTVWHVDFETRSAVDLKKTGVHVYAADPSTDAWCMAYAIDEHPAHLLRNDQFTIPGVVAQIKSHVAAGGIVMAHNAAFELAIWNAVMVPRYGWPVLHPEQCRCTMAMAYAMALPGSLENAAAAVGLEIRKDMDGRNVMMRMAKPRKINDDGTIIWWEDEDRLQKLYAYCKQDVEVERALEKRLRPLSPEEQQLWVLDQQINNRGIHVDLPVIHKAIRIVEKEKARLDRAMAKVTGGQVTTCNQVAALTEWITGQGIDVNGLAKADIVELLDRDLVQEIVFGQGCILPGDPSERAAKIRTALELRREAAKSSTAKLKAMVAGADADSRCRGIHQFHVASTGRWGGRRVQGQNMPRPVMDQDEIEDVFQILEDVR